MRLLRQTRSRRFREFTNTGLAVFAGESIFVRIAPSGHQGIMDFVSYICGRFAFQNISGPDCGKNRVNLCTRKINYDLIVAETSTHHSAARSGTAIKVGSGRTTPGDDSLNVSKDNLEAYSSVHTVGGVSGPALEGRSVAFWARLRNS